MNTPDKATIAESDEIENVRRQVKQAAYVGIHAGNYGLRHYLSHEQKSIVEAALAALSRTAPTPAAAMSRTSLIRAMCHAKPAACKCADQGGIVDDYDACRIVSSHANAILDSTPAPAAEVTGLETIQTLLDLLNPLHGSLDKQTYDEKVRADFDAPSDAEYAVNVTAQQERDLTQAVMILEDHKRQALVNPSTDAGRVPEGWKLAPIEPTRKMVDAVSGRLRSAGPPTAQQRMDAEQRAISIYKDMLAASPAHDEVKS